MHNLLDNIHLPQDIKSLSDGDCRQLAEEIREFLVKSVADTGGHLASNLGVVELTLALYKTFDFPKDKIVWDVGHQSYVHKILSGRKDLFPSLRKLGGMSGFPKTAESEYDSFNTGHSSTSVSAALGMARARDLSGENNNIIAVFGDGALTGGMIYEALNDAGHTKTRLILVLNDNAMSISRNVGAISKHLRNLRSKPFYFKSKKRIERIISKIPVCGNSLARFIRHTKRFVRNLVLPPSMFDDLGIEYIGPVDGHNINAVCSALEAAKQSQKPILIHVLTKKGKGYAPAEQNPQYFHGVSHFDVDIKEFEVPQKNDYSAVFGKKLAALAEENDKIIGITAAMPIGTGFDEFALKFKPRFFDVGIAEPHAVTLAAGLAISGYTPVVSIYSSFCQRAYDQILHDVCLQNLHVVFCIDRAGVVGSDGETHHGLFDIAYLSAMPNMRILSPSSFGELEEMLDFAVNKCTGPIAIRYPRGGGQYENAKPFCFGAANVAADGGDITIISSGRMMRTAQEVRGLLQAKNISAALIELPTILPLDKETILSHAEKTGLISVIEDHSETGGISSLVAAAVAEADFSAKLMSFAYPAKPITHGTTEELDALYGLDAESICTKITAEVLSPNRGGNAE